VCENALAEGLVNVSSSLDVLRQMAPGARHCDAEHEQLLDELGVGGSGLLDPTARAQRGSGPGECYRNH